MSDSEVGAICIANLLECLKVHLNLYRTNESELQVKRRKIEKERVRIGHSAVQIDNWVLKHTPILQQSLDGQEITDSNSGSNTFEDYLHVGILKIALDVDGYNWDTWLLNLRGSLEVFKLPAELLFSANAEDESLHVYSTSLHNHTYLPILEKRSKNASILSTVLREATKKEHLKVKTLFNLDVVNSNVDLLLNVYLSSSLISSNGKVPVDVREILKALLCQNISYTENEINDTLALYSYLQTHKRLHNEEAMLNKNLLSELKVTLYPFQERSIRWLLQREGVFSPTQKMNRIAVWWKESQKEDGLAQFQFNILTGQITDDLSWEDQYTIYAPRGGILAEEMGLGKSIELIALHILHRPSSQELQEISTLADSRGLLPSSATLIVTPPTISQQWITEIQTHAPSLRCVLFEKDRISTEELSRYDIVVISFDLLSKQLYYAQETKSRSRRFPSRYKYPPSQLIQILWWRVVIDEVQIVESLFSRAAEMLYHIPRINSWVVSGTPIKHSRNDLIVLLKFLRVEPFSSDSSLWKLLMAPENFEHFIILFRSIMQRTLKSQVQSELSIPAQHTESILLEFSDVEQYFYESLRNSCVDELIWATTVEEKKLKMREWLYRLRQTCCHPQVGSRNRKILGGTLRSISEVLEFMFQHARASAQSLERGYTAAKIKRAQILESNGKLEEAKCLYHEILKETQRQMENLNKEIDLVNTSLPKSSTSNQPDSDKTQIGTINLSGDREGEVLDTLSSDLHGDKEDLKSPKLWLHLWREIEHRLFFFLGSIYFKLENEAEENVYYQLAEASRTEILKPLSQGFQLELERFNRFLTSIKVDLAHPCPIPSSEFTGGILSHDLFERIESVTTALNVQNEILQSCHDAILKKLVSSLWDAGDNAANGEEFQQSQLQQEEVDIYQDVFMRIIHDRRHLIQGVTIGLREPQLRGGLEISETTALFRKQYIRPLAHENLKTHLSELRQILNKPNIHREEVFIVEQEFRRLSKVVDELSTTLQLYEREIVMFRKLYNSRIEYYRQLQKISDDVIELQCLDYDKELELCKENEHKLQAEIVRTEGKLRYLLNLKETTGTERQQEQGRLCLICQMDFSTGMITPCGHIFCLECSKKWFCQHSKCPTCNSYIERSHLNSVCFVPKSIETRESLAPDQTLLQKIRHINVEGSFGTKIDMLIRHIKYIHQHHQKTNGLASKVIVFSQWDSVLNVISLGLERNRIRFVRLVGKDKNHTAVKFSNDDSIQVILLNAKSQSSGLTLIAANHILFCEPIVNPGLELQAVNRVHRIGQTRETYVYWYIVQNTIEEKIYELYQKKSKNLNEHLNDISTSDIQRTLLDKKRTGFGEIVCDEDLKYFFDALGINL